QSETDTEVALHLFEKVGFLKGFKQIVGMNAFILLDSVNNQLLTVKNGSPLIIGLGKDNNYISSDVWALLNHTNKMIILEDNQLAQITGKKVKLFSVSNGKAIKPKVVILDWQAEQSRLGKFHHYMEKEIFDQPKIITNLVSQDFTAIKKFIKPNRKTFFLGCGTAYYAALFAEYCFRLKGFEAEAVMASEYQKIVRGVNKEQLLIVLSQSGETIDIIESVKELKKKKIPIVALTNVFGSTLYRLADYNILLGAGQEVAVASTKAFTAKLAVILILMGLNSNLIKAAAALVLDQKKIRSLSKTIKDCEHIFVIGRGLSYPIALEAALKIKEVSYIHAEAYAAGELKHGPIALIDQGTPAIVMASNDETFSDMISSAHEIKARGGLIIGISPQNNPIFDIYLSVPDLKQATVIPMTVISQLLAYDLAIARG
ncbi:MAG: isomerizing glutamine--fructose-6-phosphate transaminase, partial [Patescibacteria group bacterium]|nr:isomerizing glutamine--fructose-6-phosphate transaminase [Patescibacteria group bacterium]